MRGLTHKHNLQHDPSGNRYTDSFFKCEPYRCRCDDFVRPPNDGGSSEMNTDFPKKVLQVLESVAETGEVRSNLELPLYECQVLDSIKTVELMIRVEEEFGLKVAPSEFERENWGTPRRIIADLASRLRVQV